MNKYLLMSLLLIPVLSFADNAPEKFDNQPILPTLGKMRNATWTWKSFSDLPSMEKLEQDSQNKNRYMMTQSIKDKNPKITITFYGTKERPEVAVIESRTWGALNTLDSLFVRVDKIKGSIPLASNCNFKNISIGEGVKEGDGFSYETGASLDFQQAYILPKNIRSLPSTKNDLYVASSQVESYLMTGSYQTQSYTTSIITPEKNKLGQFINSYGWRTNNKDKKVDCSVR